VHTAAVAGTVLARNSRTNWLTRLQEWEYYQGISVVKRIQSLFQGTLVAQGAFSIYETNALKAVGGWPNTVGEDIVLTWSFIAAGWRVSYAENAFAFTNVPVDYGSYYSQRKRWSRGLIEAFKNHPVMLFKPRMNSAFVYFNFLFPYIDAAFLFGFVPGVILALFFDNYAIVGVMTLFLLPLAFMINIIMYLKQTSIFEKYGLKVRKNIFGLLGYMFLYQLLLSPASLMGYLSELINTRKEW
jgi:biofilm PGA synthesis N-glycosyltransferase PgaC